MRTLPLPLQLPLQLLMHALPQLLPVAILALGGCAGSDFVRDPDGGGG